jgi:hypothetical protein
MAAAPRPCQMAASGLPKVGEEYHAEIHQTLGCVWQSSGALKPDIASTQAVRKTLLAAKTIGYSTGPSGGVVLLPGVAEAVEIKVLSTQATEQAYRELVPQFENASGHNVTTIFSAPPRRRHQIVRYRRGCPARLYMRQR